MFRLAMRVAVVVVAIVAASAVHAQVSQFEFQPHRVPLGAVLHYTKSCIDGSRSTRISVYVVDAERIESLKWDDSAASATLVQALMDWSRFSVREFRTWHLQRGAAPELSGTLIASANGGTLKVTFLGEKDVTVDRWPWHSYDFDFASLGLTLPHLRRPQADVIFWRADVVYVGEGVDFEQIGGVRMHFESAEIRNGRETRRYSIGGAGLEHLYGKLWTDASSGLLIEYQIPLGDEPGYKDVHLRLDRMERMSAAQWEAFKKAKIGEP